MSRVQGWLGAAALLAALVLPIRAHASVEYYHTDALGTPVAVTDEYRAVVERSEYEPYAALLNRPLEDGPGYTGHVSDAATGLSYMQQRYYDPQIGRFLSVDPVTADGNTGGNFNRYWYANNNPYKFTDPDGRESACISNGGNCGMGPGTGQRIMEVAPVVADFTPGIGDVKGAVEAIQDPTPANIAAAVVGVVPVVGDAAAKVIKTADKVADATKSGRRAGDFTRAQKNAAKAENAAANGGKMACTDCGKGVENVASQKGVPTPGNQAQVHHDPAIKDGGGQHSKPVVLCPECHKDRHGQ